MIAPLTDEKRAVIDAVANDVDVMGGLGHPSMLTPEGLERRHAAVLIRALADEVDRLRASLVLWGCDCDAPGCEGVVTPDSSRCHDCGREATPLYTIRPPA